MTKDELLPALCQTILNETTLPPDWEKLIMVGEMDGGSGGLGGYSFNAAGQHQAAAPRGGQSLELLEQLHAAMLADSPTGRPWVACLIRIGHDGQIGVDFEYADPHRWAVTPKNLKTRIAEFMAMPV